VRKKSEPISLHTLSKGLENYLIKAGLRTIDHTANKRKEIARAHGFRKFFTKQLINSKVNPEIREMLLGHSIGLAGAYYKPTEERQCKIIPRVRYNNECGKLQYGFEYGRDFYFSDKCSWSRFPEDNGPYEYNQTVGLRSG
jgi:hypothetical protein